MMGNQVEDGTRKLAMIGRDNTSRVWVSRGHRLNAGKTYAALIFQAELNSHSISHLHCPLSSFEILYSTIHLAPLI